MTNIAVVIGWKFEHQPGMRCDEIVIERTNEETGKIEKEFTGRLAITEFPGGIPSQADQDKWTAEYEEYQAQLDRPSPVTAPSTFGIAH